MNHKKIGLALGGGGGKGAYQLGILKALEEYKVINKVTHISGTSIGAMNMVLYLSGKTKGSEKVWKEINKEVALGKMTFKEVLATKSLFSREGIINVADNHINFKKVRKSKKQAYAIATPKGFGSKNAPYAFDVTKQKNDKIVNILLASSAIPLIFSSVTIDGVKYYDGFGVENVPISILKEKGCSLILVVPLKETSNAYKYVDEDTKIIDFVSPYNDYNMITGTLDFKSSRIKMRADHGYYIAKTLIEKLIDQGFLEPTIKSKIKNKAKNLFKVKNEFGEKEMNYFKLEKKEIKEKPIEREEKMEKEEEKMFLDKFKIFKETGEKENKNG